MGSEAAQLLRSTHVSYSKLSTYEQCPMRFRLEYLERHESKPSGAAQLGTAVHAIIANYLSEIRGVARAFRPTAENLASRITPVCRELRESGELTRWIEATEIIPYLESFVRLMPQVDGRAIAAVEETKQTKIGPWVLKAILDLVLVNAKGEVHLIDFKTGKPEYVEDAQLKSYALPILGSRAKPVEKLKASYVFLKGGQMRSFGVRREHCEDIVGDISRKVRRIEADIEFPSKVGPLCRWCGVKNHCRAR